MENTQSITRIPEFISERKYFAALAMQGLLSCTSNKDMLLYIQRWADKENVKFEELISKWSVEQADALIKELNKQP